MESQIICCSKQQNKSLEYSNSSHDPYECHALRKEGKQTVLIPIAELVVSPGDSVRHQAIFRIEKFVQLKEHHDAVDEEHKGKSNSHVSGNPQSLFPGSIVEKRIPTHDCCRQLGFFPLTRLLFRCVLWSYFIVSIQPSMTNDC